MSGVLLMSIGFLLASFGKSVLHLLLTQGFLAGMGMSLLYFPVLAPAPEYFTNHRATAMGFVSLAPFPFSSFPPLTQMTRSSRAPAQAASSFPPSSAHSSPPSAAAGTSASTPSSTSFSASPSPTPVPPAASSSPPHPHPLPLNPPTPEEHARLPRRYVPRNIHPLHHRCLPLPNPACYPGGYVARLPRDSGSRGL